MSLQPAEQYIETVLDEMDDELAITESDRGEIQKIRDDMRSGRIDLDKAFSRVTRWLFSQIRRFA